MQEYQVKWIPNKNMLTKDRDPYKIEILLIKHRDVILKMRSNYDSIGRYMIVPLYEKPQSRGQIPMINKQGFLITGVQLIIQYKYGKKKSVICYQNFRNSINTDLYDVEGVFFNFNNKFTRSRTRVIEQHHFNGIYAETEFKHQRGLDLLSDHINSQLFNNNESNHILSIVNNQALNSFPLDFLGLMDLPQINKNWFLI